MQITIHQPDDFHVHFRRGEILKTVVPYTAQWFRRALVMPNTDPPILTGEDCISYKEDILSVSKNIAPDFEPLMAIKLTHSTRAKCIYAAHKAGVIVSKVYPVGVTTNAEDGIKDFRRLVPVFLAMEEVGMVLSIHGEQPDFPCLGREVAFLPTLCALAEKFPKLRIVMEHLSTRKAVETITGLPDTVGATITAHHQVLTTEDVYGQPHNFCLPIAKNKDDRQALIEAATSGNPKFWFGSDTAPHPINQKECCKAKPGVFTPNSLQVLAQVFEGVGALNRLQAFTSEFGARYYQLPFNESTLILEKKPFVVPDRIGNIVPFMAGETLEWSVEAN